MTVLYSKTISLLLTGSYHTRNERVYTIAEIKFLEDSLTQTRTDRGLTWNCICQSDAYWIMHAEPMRPTLGGQAEPNTRHGYQQLTSPFTNSLRRPCLRLPVSILSDRRQARAVKWLRCPFDSGSMWGKRWSFENIRRAQGQTCPPVPCCEVEGVEFWPPGILRQQKYAHVLPGPWPKKWQHFAERVVGALYLPRAPVNQAEEL